jgi:hypothetical protein
MGQPEQREEPTYAAATAEQVAEARVEARRKLAEADAYWTPERRERAYQEFDRRIADAAA